MQNIMRGRAEVVQLVWSELVQQHSANELTRIRGMLDIWSGEREAKADFNEQECYGLYMPGLPDAVWLAPDQFAFHELVKAAWLGIRNEARPLLDGRRRAPAFALPVDADPGDPSRPDERGYEWPEGWREWRFYDYHERIDARCEVFPYAASVADSVRAVSDYVARIHFLLMQPNTDLQRHVDETNFLVNYQLCVASTAEAGFEVAGIRKEWRDGEIHAFNAGYFHSAWNHSSTGTRVLFSVRTLHPDLSKVERDALLHLMSRVAYVRSNSQASGEGALLLQSE